MPWGKATLLQTNCRPLVVDVGNLWILICGAWESMKAWRLHSQHISPPVKSVEIRQELSISIFCLDDPSSILSFQLILSPYHVFHHTFRWSPGSQVPSGSRPSNFSNFSSSSRSKPTWWPSTPASVASNGSPNGLPPWECCSRFPKMRPGCGDLGDGLDEPHKMGTKRKSLFGESWVMVGWRWSCSTGGLQCLFFLSSFWSQSSMVWLVKPGFTLQHPSHARNHRPIPPLVVTG